tara:strand:- start:3645 stop:4769 length:1125 start_codon:yes stop_codon:yes gene_type:complete
VIADEWQQARRLAVSEHRLLRRHARAVLALSLLQASLLVIFQELGLLNASTLYYRSLLAGLVVLAALYTVLIELGVTLRWREPSLSKPMSLGLVAVLLATAYPMEGGRIGAMMLFYPLMLLVSFRLGIRALIVVAVFASGGYALILALAIANHGVRLNVTLEVLQWLVFTLVGFSFVVTGSGVNGLRRSLAVKNHALADALEQVRSLAIRDDLTSLFNRRHIMEVLDRQKALADSRDYPFSVCYVDLDYFKRINDAYGHDCGDRVLRQFAAHTLGGLREGDYLARLGGEEFILVLPQSHLEGAQRVAERLRESWAAHGFAADNGPPSVSLSIGVAEYRRAETIDQLIARADRALYLAKSGGRNRVCLAQEQATG